MNESIRVLLSRIERIDRAPVLRTVNGIGLRISGRILIPTVEKYYITAQWVTIFFIPIIPIKYYLVSAASEVGGTYHFAGSVRFSHLLEAYGARFWWLVLSAWLEGGAFLLAFLIVLGAVFLLFAGVRQGMR